MRHEHVYVDNALGWSRCQVPDCGSWYPPLRPGAGGEEAVLRPLRPARKKRGGRVAPTTARKVTRSQGPGEASHDPAA